MQDEGLPIRKIIVDSRSATIGSGSDFQVQLPETLNIPSRGYCCYVTDICCTHSWRTVHGSSSIGAKNHYLYFLERLYDSAFGNDDYTVFNRATLTPGSYTPAELAVEMQTKMNAVSFFCPNAYTVTYSSTTQTMDIPVNFADTTYPNFHGFQIVSTAIMADQVFQAYAGLRQLYNGNGTAYPNSTPTGYPVDFNSPQDASGLLNVDAAVSKRAAVDSLMVFLNTYNTSGTLSTTQTTGVVDVRNVHVVYLHSNALSNFGTIGPAGSRTVLARLPVTNLNGSVLFKQHSGNSHDYTDCSGKMLRVLDFQIKNSSNELIDLHGGHCSFELVFAPIP